MNISKKNLNQISDNLLSFFKQHLGETKIEYDSPPVILEGGNETFIFRFSLKNIHPSLSKPLVLRKFRKTHSPKHAVKEKIVHNSLYNQGFSVPFVHYACLDNKYLGSQFLIMDFLPGKMLALVCGNDTNVVLGRTHAELHKADSRQLNEDMTKEGFGREYYYLEARLNRLIKVTGRLFWLEEVVLWLLENKPPECKQPSICHGDFHPGNLLGKKGEVSAILDWSCCQVGDPTMDVASTLVVFNTATKHIIKSFDSTTECQRYLESYNGERDLNEENLNYYQVLECVNHLISGINGVLVWTHPPILNELINTINDYSKIHVNFPNDRIGEFHIK